MVHKDCEREGNRDMLYLLWKYHMVNFWENNHSKYLILGHRFISCKSFVKKKLTVTRLSLLEF